MEKVLIKKICLMVSVLFAMGTQVQAQKTSPSVTFNVSDDGKTLTISGQGDLTTYQATSDELKFTAKGAVKVGTTNNQYSNSPVGTSAVYNSTTAYYAYYPKKIASLYPEYADATATTAWNEKKIGGLYHTNDWGNTWTAVTASDEIDLNSGWVNKKEYSNYSTTEDATGRILLADFKNSDYFTTTLTDVTFKSDKKKNLYVLSNNKYVKLADDATYDANETYYYWDETSYDANVISFGKISEEEMLRMGYLEQPTETFAQMLNYKLTKSNTYEKIQFVNEGTGAMTINKDIVKAILYPSATANSVLTTLDLGAATCAGFSNGTFAADGANGTLALTSLTLPLTNKTSVLSESTGALVDKMVVPTQVVSTLNSGLTTVTIPEGYDRVGNEAFANSSITKVNFPNSLTLIGESAFYNCTKIASITLNEGLENIGKKAFMDLKSLTALNFPSTLKIIHDEAFRNCYVYDLKFNAGLQFIGKGAFALLNYKRAETTLEIPASMRYIGAIAFGNRRYQDVFFYGENAPLMPFGTIEGWQGTGSAFDEVTLMGNNGFDPKKGEISDDANTGYANRENYKNQGVYFCLLHFPKDLTDEQRAAYTDITRVYKTVDEGQKFYYGQSESNPYSYHEVGEEEEETELKFSSYTASKKTSCGFQDTYLGRQYIWPSQQEWTRSYVVNSLGYNWNGKDKYLPTLSAEDLAVLAYAGYKVADADHPADEKTGYYTLENLQMMAHMGTRQFPLGNSDVNVDKKPEEKPTYPINIKGGQWWTICVPFDMTKAQVDEVFGVDTHVCRFNKVERVVNSEEKVKSIKLFFTNDVYVHKSTKDANGKYTTSTGTSVADDDIVIYAHESYMIYPTKNNDDANSMYNISDYTLVTGSPLPTLVKANEQFTGGAKESASDEADWNKEYRFVGNYQTAVAVSETAQASEETFARDVKNVTVPQYSYIYAQKKGTPRAQFWFYTGTQMLWGANKCVVQATARDGGKSDYLTYFGGNGTGAAKELSFFGKDEDVTGIENVEIIAGNENDTQIVYNLNGQVVNGNLNSLQKGVYIKNGKKFMVK